jgi:UDP-N-acetyl-D-glucosamine/UDP-N-acetyl-D-galactosamine dehydrogenase
MEYRIAVVGLGYVGLPLAVAFARKFPGTVGFDIDQNKLRLMREGIDPNNEGLDQELRETSLTFTSSPGDLVGCNFFVIGVPTPIDQNRNPDLRALLKASATVGVAIRKGGIAVFESTVYPGVTEEVCGPVIEKVSGLKMGEDFFLGYSPERINPGDREHTLERVVKVVSAQDEKTLEHVSNVYGAVVEAGLHRAPSIKVAEAAKVIENTQRDVNIALMNEIAIIFDRMGISTRDVLAAAGTKWNFLRFTPGLVGGHCIGVDPYYLTTKAEQLGYHPEVILSGRRINDDMGRFIAQRCVKLMVHGGSTVKGARIGILGLSFKENVSDIRNSRVPDIIEELKAFGVEPVVYDPFASAEIAKHEYGIELAKKSDLTNLDGVVLAVPHDQFVKEGFPALAKLVRQGGVFLDVKAAFRPGTDTHVTYWSF